MKINFKKNVASSFAMMGVFFALVFFNAGCSKEEPKPKPVAKFTMSANSGIVPFDVICTNQSENATRYEWTVSSGSAPNTNKDITVLVRGTGTITVTLRAIGDGGEDVTSQTITATAPLIKPTARFTSSPSTGFAPLLVQFNNTSLNAASYSWSLDGVPSNLTSPSHNFTTSGTKRITLEARNTGGIDVATGTVTVLPNPDIAASVSTIVVGQPVNFTSNHSTSLKHSWDVITNNNTKILVDNTLVAENNLRATIWSEGTTTVSVIVTDPQGVRRASSVKSYNVVKAKDGVISLPTGGNSSNQVWIVYGNGTAIENSSRLRFVSRTYQMPFDANTTNKPPYLYGSKIYDLSNGNPYQNFAVIPSNESGYFLLYSIQHGTGFVLDAGGGANNGAGGLYWSNRPDKNNDWQKFRFSRVLDNQFFIINKKGGYIQADY
jgi:PKD repeat protein